MIVCFIFQKKTKRRADNMEILSFIGYAYVPLSICYLVLSSISSSRKIDRIETNVSQIWDMVNALSKDVDKLLPKENKADELKLEEFYESASN